MKQSHAPDSVILDQPARSRAFLPILFAGAIVVAALYYGQELMVPLVLASLLAFVLAPACRLLQRLFLPRTVAVLVAVVLTFAAIGGLGTVVGRQAAALATSLPTYSATIEAKWQALSSKLGLLERYTAEIGKTARGAAKATATSTGAEEGSGSSPAAQVPGTQTAKGPGATLGLPDISGFTLAKTVAQPLLGSLGTLGITLVFTIFVLLSNEDLRDRLVRLVGRNDLHRTILAMNDAASRLSRYFLFQLALNTCFGLVIGLCLWALHLPNPLLWGILAAAMRFVPFIGVVLAVIPPLLLAIAVTPGWTLAILVAALFAAAETLTGQVIEPLIYGHSTGLSPLAVIVATAFWALIWGPVGLLIATPLTVCLVVIGRHVEPLAFFDVILGDRPPLQPEETFYQRALEGHAVALLPAARQQITASSMTDYYDRVALPGLALAQGDLARDSLAFERLEAIHGQIEILLDKLKGTAPIKGAMEIETTELPVSWRHAGAVYCIPGRGQLDDLAAAMAVQSLVGAGFGARVEPNLVLGAKKAMPSDMSGAKVCCLSVLEAGSNASGIRYFIRRIQKQMPNATVVVGLWHVDRDSPLLASLRAEGEEEHLVLSIGELVAFCRALAARAETAEAMHRPALRSPEQSPA